jgi:hypothetical protein
MIDTIVLTLKQGMFNIMRHDYFSPSTEGLYNPSDYYRLGSRSNMVCKQNPTPSELKAGIYKPRLTVTKRMNRLRQFEITMKVEFSVPKLLFGNNFDELEEADFEKVIQILKQKLRDMGVYIFESILINAPVSAIHYGKNIPLTDYTTPYTYLEMLSKSNINQRLDLNQTDFRNEGHSLKYRANSFEVVFYDKLKDLNKAKGSEKRAEEKDNAVQLNLFEEKKMKKPFEVLRMEVRLNKKQKLMQIIKRVGIVAEPTFKTLFKKETAQKVLLYYLDEIEAGYPYLLTYTANDPKDFLSEFIIHNPKVGLRKAMQMLGLWVMLKNVGIREFREIIRKYGNTNWYNLNKELKELRYPNRKDAFAVLKNVITECKPLKLTDYNEAKFNY